MLDIFISAFIIYLVIIDPMGTASVFIALSSKLSRKQKITACVEAILVATFILIFFALFGSWLLDYLNVSLASFKISGGIILLLVALDMLSNKRQERKRNDTNINDDSANSIIFPLAIPIIAGPAAITSVMIVSANYQDNLNSLLLNYAALASVMLLTLIVLIMVSIAGRLINLKISDVIARIAAILLTALSIQYILDGMKESHLF